jgi:hypothetical protein
MLQFLCSVSVIKISVRTYLIKTLSLLSCFYSEAAFLVAIILNLLPYFKNKVSSKKIYRNRKNYHKTKKSKVELFDCGIKEATSVYRTTS